MRLDIRTGESSWGPPPHELSPYNVTFGRQRLGSWSLSAPASTDMSVESLRLAVYQSSVRGCFSGNARQIPQQKFSFPFFKRGRGAGAEPLVPLVNRSTNQNLKRRGRERRGVGRKRWFLRYFGDWQNINNYAQNKRYSFRRICVNCWQSSGSGV